MPKEVFLDVLMTTHDLGEYERYDAYQGFHVGWQAGTGYLELVPIIRYQDPQTKQWHEERDISSLALDSADLARLIKTLKKAQSQLPHTGGTHHGYALGAAKRDES